MQSEKINELATALSKVQSELRPAVRSATNPFFHSKYAPLDVVWDSCRAVLGAHGFAVTQSTTTFPNTLLTTLMHSSGQWVSGAYPLPEVADPQKFASAITYARRYALSALVGVVTLDEDDDGNLATGREQHQQQQPRYTPPPAIVRTTPTPPHQRDAVADVVKMFGAKVVSAEADENAEWFLNAEFKIGKYKGQRIKDAPPKSVQWYAENFEPKEQYPDSIRFRKALDAWAVWSAKNASIPPVVPKTRIGEEDGDGSQVPF